MTEGSTVTVVLREDDEAFELTPEEEEELLESIAEIERGEFVSGEELLERLLRRLSPPPQIRVSPQAVAQIEEAARWWTRNRPSAPNAIQHDVAEMLSVLSTQPGVGAPARRGRVKGVRRVNLTTAAARVSWQVAVGGLLIVAGSIVILLVQWAVR